MLLPISSRSKAGYAQSYCRVRSTSSPVGMRVGSDAAPLPNDHPTIGFQLNHLMLRIRDPKPSPKFYTDLMGMRQIFS